MAAQLSDLDDQKSGATAQTEGQTLTPPMAEISPVTRSCLIMMIMLEVLLRLLFILSV